MAHRTARGRPKKIQEDAATPQLRAKHASGLTREPLDMLLERGVIVPAEHAAGMRLRFWHAVAFGVAAPRSAFRWLPGETGAEPMDEATRAECKTRYEMVRGQLQRAGEWSVVAVVCLPGFGLMRGDAGHLGVEALRYGLRRIIKLS